MDLEIWAPSKISWISPLAHRLIRLVELSGSVPGEEADVELALLEAISNAVVHGNQSDERKQFHVKCRCVKGVGVSIVVSDEGQGFDPTMIPEAVSIECERGRGIALMKFYMDRVSFKKEGTEVHMWKASRRKPRTAPACSQPMHRAEEEIRSAPVP